jgi:curved DNA binding protein
MSEAKEDTQALEDPRNPDVVTKYRIAGDLANAALKYVISECKPGTKIVDICELGDKWITEETSKIYKGKKIEKGIGFPTCISVNNIVGHFSPLAADEREIKKGDVAKIDLGVHIDGYIAVAAHTILVGDAGEETEITTGKLADVIHAAHTAAECAIRMIKAGQKNQPITDMFSVVADAFGVNVLTGVLSHEMSRMVIDGEKCIISKTDVDQKVDDFDFEPNQVFAIDVVMTTGEGKPKEVDERTCVYKRDVENQYKLKMKASRQIMSDIITRFPTFPFTIRAMDEKTVRFGIVECAKHKLVNGYPVLYEKEGEFIAHFKFTVVLMPTGALKITGLPINLEKFKTEHSLKEGPEETKEAREKLIQLLATSVGKKKKKNNKKKKAASGDAKEDKN